MKLFSGKTGPSADADARLADQLKASEERNRCCTEALKLALSALRQAVFDPSDPDSRELIQAIDTLGGLLSDQTPAPAPSSEAGRQHARILSGLERQRRVLEDKEKTFKEIVALLTRAIADVSADNQLFADTVSRQSDTIEQLTHLDEILRLRAAVAQEIAGLRSAIQEKRDRDAKVVDGLSQQVSSLKSELESSRQAAMRDGLTGLFNEPALNRYLKTLTQPGAQRPFALVVADIDKFDRIEKTYGEALGQRVILAASQECRAVFDTDAFIARYKQGTFVVILPDQPLKTAATQAKALCRSLAQKRYQIDAALEGHTLTFTVSAGVSTFRGQESAATVTSRAIQALAAARRSGTGQVVTEKSVFLRFRSGGAERIEDLYP